jgi:hypothetical protein
MIKHLIGVFKKPGKVRVYETVAKAQECKFKWKNVAYRHTGRDFNKVPDDMARRALAVESQVIYWDGQVPEDAPANQLQHLYFDPSAEGNGFI